MNRATACIVVGILVVGCGQGDTTSKGSPATPKEAQPQSTSSPKPPAVPVSAPWNEEPKAFMGIALDEPLQVSAPKPCPTSYSQLDIGRAKKLGQPCHHEINYKSGKGPYTLCCFGVAPFREKGFVQTWPSALDGNVNYVQVMFLKENFGQVVDALTLKYGPPHTKESRTVKTVGGVALDSTIAKWKGANVEIVADALVERGLDHGEFVEVGGVFVTTSAFHRQAEEEKAEAARKAAGKL